MAKLRKMLCDINSDICKDLMALIETQSQKTLGIFSLNYVRAHYYPYLDPVFDEEMAGCLAFLEKRMSAKEFASLMKQAREKQKLFKEPSKEALAKAIVGGIGAARTPTNTLGFTFYGACGLAYEKLGYEKSEEAYMQIYYEETKRVYEALKEVAVEDEKHPAKINWNC